MSLGPASGSNLAKARRDAAEVSELVRNGIDPIAARMGESSGESFRNVSLAFIELKGTGWRNAKHRQQWPNSLETYAAALMDMPVAAITTEDVLEVLKAIWSSKPETASRVRGRIENVLDAAKARGLRSGENPAAWKGNLAHLLPSRRKLVRGHQRALDYAKAPAFASDLRKRGGVACRALEFTLLTAVRTSEAIRATWNEIDLDTRVWSIPADRTKTRTTLRVPLCGAAVAILQDVRPLCRNEWVFPNQSLTGPLSTAAMDAVLRRMNLKGEMTVHGLRSTFRDWAGEETDYQRDVIEMALGHKVGSAVERAYRRGDALEKRRALMTAWEKFLTA